MKTLPNEITYLSALTSLKVASNKLAELPPGMSSMRRLEVLDLSHNGLTSLGPFDLCSMQNLERLNLQEMDFLLMNRLVLLLRWICMRQPCKRVKEVFLVKVHV